ncbi:hypothetical protein N7488_008805 [Penicillium malachiteum]|nr:hypothetical protein N7488_008805 [Penicillium malachiteum]
MPPLQAETASVPLWRPAPLQHGHRHITPRPRNHYPDLFPSRSHFLTQQILNDTLLINANVFVRDQIQRALPVIDKASGGLFNTPRKLDIPMTRGKRENRSDPNPTSNEEYSITRQHFSHRVIGVQAFHKSEQVMARTQRPCHACRLADIQGDPTR